MKLSEVNEKLILVYTYDIKNYVSFHLFDFYL